MSSLTKKEIMLFVKNALKSKDKIKMEKAELYINKWKESKCNYFYDLSDDIISLINGMAKKIIEKDKRIKVLKKEHDQINSLPVLFTFPCRYFGDEVGTVISLRLYSKNSFYFTKPSKELRNEAKALGYKNGFDYFVGDWGNARDIVEHKLVVREILWDAIENKKYKTIKQWKKVNDAFQLLLKK